MSNSTVAVGYLYSLPAGAPSVAVWAETLTEDSGKHSLIKISANRPIINTVQIVANTADKFAKVITMSPKDSVIYEDDPEIAAMSSAELLAGVKAAYGSWADRDDIDDEWLDTLRTGWDSRMEKLYGDDTNPKISP